MVEILQGATQYLEGNKVCLFPKYLAGAFHPLFLNQAVMFFNVGIL